MSKTFSTIELETETGIVATGFVGGIPDSEDIQSTDLYQELLEDCEDVQFIDVRVQSYNYGIGESEPADEKDIEFIGSQEDFINQGDAVLLQSDSFTIFIDEQKINMNM